MWRVLSKDCEVKTESRAEAALVRLLGGERYDIVLCDLMMTSMDGIEFHRRLVATLPEQAHRVVFITGGALTARVDAFFRRVPNLLLEKPLDLEGVRALVDRRIRDGAAKVAGERA